MIFSELERQFITDYALGHSRKEIMIAVNSRFNVAYSERQINNFLKYNHIKTGYRNHRNLN